MKLSFSSLNKYVKCPKLYKLHYIDNIREVNKGSALLFGTAIGSAVESLLKDPDRSLERCLESFKDKWSVQDINGTNELIGRSNKILFFNNDFDVDVLSSEDIEKIFSVLSSFGYEFDHNNLDKIHTELKQKKRDKVFGENERIIFNYISWISLAKKGEMILTAFHEQVLPKIKEVIGTEVKISLINEVGDELLGYIDLICIWEDGRCIKFDFKTSSTPYKANSVKESEQLSTYDLTNTADALGYIVFEKNIRKREPRVRISVIIDNIDEAFKDKVVEEYDSACESIKAGKFDPNLDSCVSKEGFRCPMYNLCKHNSMSGLIKQDKK